MYYTGWELFRQDPHWHWPLTYTDRVGYPLGDAVALMDINPLFAVLLKPLSPLLPEPFQYLGIEVVLACALQFFFATRLFRIILGRNLLGIGLCSLFFLVAPPLAGRATGHYTLTNQWLLVAALLVYFQAQQESPGTMRRFVIASLLLATVAVAINPYLAFQVLLVLTAAAGSLLWQRRLTLPRAAGFMAAMGVTSVTVAYSLGFFITGGKGYVAPGYRFLATNLLSPFYPYIYGPYPCGLILSRLLPYVPNRTMELGNYLGAGVIFLGIFLVAVLVMRRGKRPSFDRRGLVLCFCVVWCSLSWPFRPGSGSGP